MNMIQALANYVAQQPTFSKPTRAFVSIYRSHRCYGGPEEGGWWYTVMVFEGGLPFISREDAEQWLETAKVEIERRNREEAPARARAMAALPDCDAEPLPDAGEGYIPVGWDDGGKLEILVEDVMGESDTSQNPRPHYE